MHLNNTDTDLYTTVNEMAQAKEVTIRYIQKLAKDKQWPVQVINKRGDQRFVIDSLPEEIRLEVKLHRAKKMAGTDLSDNSEMMPAVVRPVIVADDLPKRQLTLVSPELTAWQNTRGLAWADLIRTYVNEKNRAKSAGESIIEAADKFIIAFNTGHLLPNVYALIGKTSVGTTERQLKKFRDANFDYTVLAPQWGNNRGHRKVTNEEFNNLLSFALHPNKLRISECVRLTKMKMKRQQVPSPSHEATLRRALMDWKNTNYDKWVFCREGEKALNDKVLPYNDRDITALEVGDVFVTDGHVLNFQILHPFTGKPCRMTMVMWYDWASCMPVGWEIMPTENVQCVAAGLRRAIMTLGKIPKVAYLDNGKAFKAKVFTDKSIDFEEAGFYGMFARLNIETLFAWPYNAQSKVIERFFGTFAELERLMPTYTGTEISTKPAHMMRNEKLHKELHEKRYGGWVPTIQEANNIIAGWVSSYAERPHAAIKGLCPGEVLKSGMGPGVDEAELRYLMMSMEIKRVHRNGISFMGRSYYDEALYGYKEPVTMKYDFEDLSRVYVYDKTGAKLICEAPVREKVHPMAKLLGTKEDLALVKEGIKQKRSLKKLTEKSARAWVETAPALVNIPEPKQFEISDFRFEKEPGKLTQAEAEKIEKDAANMKVLEFKPKAKDPIYMSEADRYEALLERECKGETLELDDMAFMRYFEKTDMYKQLKDRFDFLYEMFLVPEEEEGKI